MPDGPLHHLAFAALRPKAGAPPLGASLALSFAPSAALFVRWRRASEARGVSPIPLLAVADPASPVAALPRLPAAAREAAAAVALLGGGSEARVGAEASEAWVRGPALGRASIVHFAVHAILDEARPSRSALALAAGEGQDGLLEVREIAGLALGGKTVVLASCRSSAGEHIQGEGLLSLARDFFRAGATTVVASHWPLRDEDSARLFPPLYGALRAGLPLDQALQQATSARIAAGAPAAAWAGVVVWGEARRPPLSAGAPGEALGRLPLEPGEALGLVCAIAGVWLLGRSFGRHHVAPWARFRGRRLRR